VRDGGGGAEQVAVGDPTGDGARPAPVLGPRRAWPPGRSLRTAVALAVVVVLGILAALWVTNLRGSKGPLLTTNQIDALVNQKVSTAISQLESQPPAAASAYQAVRAGLVLIEAQHQPAQGADDLGTEDLGTEDLGTGVIVDTQGDILTALHVVQGASEIKVTFADGTTSAASITAADPTHDIAVLAAGRLPAVIEPAVLGPSPQIGDETFAVGNPLGLVGSLSAGVISGLDRTFKVGNGRALSGMIQFDAAVNPGSSGGPLLNTKGQVIGIVTGLANPAGTDNFAGIGFAVPIATAGQAAGVPAK
jgi:S1-C subfamily serine protease